MGRKSGKSRGSRNTEKTRLSDQSNKIDLDKETGSDIDLSKNDDITIDDKESNSDDFGEFSKEIELYNDDEGTSISGVVGVDIVPLGLNISANGDIGTVGIDIGLPGDVIGIGGSINVNLETGEIVGGAGSISYGGASVEVSTTKNDGETCTSLTITYFGVGVSYQRCKKDNEDDEKDPPKEPPPPNDDEIPPPNIPPIPPLPGKPGDILECHFAYLGSEDFAVYKTTINGKISSKNIQQGKETVNIIFGGIDGRPSEWSLSNPGAKDNRYYYDIEGILINTVEHTWSSREIIGAPANAPTIGEFTWMQQYIKTNQLNETLGGQITSDSFPKSDDPNFVFIAKGYSYTYKRLIWCSVNGKPTKLETEKPKEPEPPIPPEDDMSNCCDLEPVMSLLRKVSTAIGTDQLPAMMPRSFLKNEGFRKIPSLAELAVYHVEIMDQLIGKFPIELEIKDTDPLSAGDQTKKVVLTNLAESVAELFGLAINSASDNAIQTSGSIKNLLEITLVRQAVLQNYYRLDAILDYLGAGLEEDTTTFNSTISMPKDPNNISEDVADFLQQSEIKFAYDKLANPKDTLTAKLLPIQKAADIIKAKYWKGFGKAGGDYLGAIKSWLKTYDPKNEQNDTEWKDKIDKILEEYAKDATGNIDKDRMPVIQNVTQIGSEPKPPGA